MTPLVSTDWLACELGQPDLILFDTSYYMPAEQRDGRSEYLCQHIPGAGFFDIDEVADPDTDLPHMAPSQGRFARLVEVMGVGNHHRVVFYDQKGLFSAARGWWLFRLFGHDQVAVLDGGLPKWLAEQRQVVKGAPAMVSPQRFFPRFRAELLRGLGDMRSNVQTGQEIMIDARSRERFTGIAPDPRPGIPSGHIPGSVSLPYLDLLNPDKTMKSPEVLKVLFRTAGVDGTRPVVSSCGSGLTATILSLGLAVAGFPPGAVYDGSWTEWASQGDMSA